MGSSITEKWKMSVVQVSAADAILLTPASGFVSGLVPQPRAGPTTAASRRGKTVGLRPGQFAAAPAQRALGH